MPSGLGTDDAVNLGPIATAEESDANDPVLSALERATQSYHEIRSSWLRQSNELQKMTVQRDQAREARRRLSGEVESLRDQLRQANKKSVREQDRSRQLADSLGEIHQALFSGNVYQLILRACMTITGATRGLYLTVWKENVRIRGAVDIDGYPQAPPSDYLKELCQRVVDTGDTIVCNRSGIDGDLPQPERAEERFGNFIVAAAVVLKNFNGIVLLADKIDGDFDKEDIDVVLGIGRQAAVAVENSRLQDELLNAYFSVVGVLADAVEAKDPYTRGHCEMVAHYARRTAEKLGLNSADRSIVCFGGLLHDIGKIGVSDGVLNKPGKLMPEEWDLMRSHVRIGRDLLARVPALQHVADVVLHHHEHYDGRGYPDGLSAEEISQASRIIAVTDAFCAMVSKRSYKESMSVEEARAEILRCKGSQFDPAVVDAFLDVLSEPVESDGAPDVYGLDPSFYHPFELRHALERLQDKALPADARKLP